jgi:hypothetical protein
LKLAIEVKAEERFWMADIEEPPKAVARSPVEPGKQLEM